MKNHQIIEEPDAEEIHYSICCGIDVHKAFVIACLLREGQKKEIRRYDTYTSNFQELAQWLKEENCEKIAMESTGIYWRPLYNILEENELDVILVNAAHMRNVPGRKTDIGDAQWIAKLLKQGLLKPSFILPRRQRDIKDLQRYKKSLQEERNREINRLQKQLETVNVKLSMQLSDITGKTARWLLEELLNGTIPEKEELIEKLPTQRMKNNVEQIKKSLESRMSQGQKVLIKQILKRIDTLKADIEEIEREIEAMMREEDELIKEIKEIPGIGENSARVIIAEIGTEMENFPDKEQIVSWAGLCPGKNESGGKKNSKRQ